MGIDFKFHEKFLAWARYLSWADLHRKRLDDYFEQEGERKGSGHVGRFVFFTTQWLASLWVVVEGFHELDMRDDFIDSILRNPPRRADLLRRCRNGVYHFQPDIIEPRLAAFLQDAQTAIAWARPLHFEFIRLFWHFPERNGLDHARSDEWRSAAFEILGWLPDDSPYVRITDLMRLS